MSVVVTLEADPSPAAILWFDRRGFHITEARQPNCSAGFRMLDLGKGRTRAPGIVAHAKIRNPGDRANGPGAWPRC